FSERSESVSQRSTGTEDGYPLDSSQHVGCECWKAYGYAAGEDLRATGRFENRAAGFPSPYAESRSSGVGESGSSDGCAEVGQYHSGRWTGVGTKYTSPSTERGQGRQSEDERRGHCN